MAPQLGSLVLVTVAAASAALGLSLQRADSSEAAILSLHRPPPVGNAVHLRFRETPVWLACQMRDSPADRFVHHAAAADDDNDTSSLPDVVFRAFDTGTSFNLAGRFGRRSDAADVCSQQVRVPVRGERGAAGGAAAARDAAHRRGHRDDEVRGREVVLGRPAAVRLHDAAQRAAALAVRPRGAPAARRRGGGGSVRLEAPLPARLARPRRARAARCRLPGPADRRLRHGSARRLLGRHCRLHSARPRRPALRLRLPNLPGLPRAGRDAAAATAGRPAAAAARLSGAPGKPRGPLRAGRQWRAVLSLQQGQEGDFCGTGRRWLHRSMQVPGVKGCIF
ncbi:uncharacterized protein LOC124711537 isoform X1 [Schistocerca piceifrons]|uniref:uncharacterized protein LOC124711537 isoform X1 n=1 Tax=Schistocerca piceifrons TaxID=274613 RepID=UPI001F5FADF2|nr:uncharacterized protein LOC124711537 isoform X1 [Schistocerca piceifrons]